MTVDGECSWCGKSGRMKVYTEQEGGQTVYYHDETPRQTKAQRESGDKPVDIKCRGRVTNVRP